MSKRLTDTEIWKKSWFYDLEPKYKIFWFYILSDCDSAGIWSVNIKLAENILNFKFKHEELIKIFAEQIFAISDKYWFIIDFIRFQYGYPVSQNSPMRKKLSELLNLRNLNIDTYYENLNTLSIPYRYSIDTVKDKEKDKDKDKEKEIKEKKEKENSYFNLLKQIFEDFYLSKTEIKYYFEAKDGFALSQLENKIKKACESKNITLSDNSMRAAFENLLNKLPVFYMDKLSITLINSKFNQIVSEIKSKNNGKQVDKDEEYIRRCREEIIEDITGGASN
jgi:hypothetical protein